MQAKPAATKGDKKDIEAKKCRTPEFRVSYPNVFKQSAFSGQDPTYSLVALFPKSIKGTEDYKGMARAALNAGIETWGPKEKWPKGIRLPFRDGDEDKPNNEEYKGTIFLTAKSKQKPGLVDERLDLITEDSGKFYAGCYARATLIAFAYDNKGNKGISFALQNIQKLRDGKALSGRKKPEEEFEAVDTLPGDSDDGLGGDEDLGGVDDGLG